jgi:hypothetical protein
MPGLSPDAPGGNGNNKNKSRSPSGMTTKKAVRLLVGFGGGEGLLDAGAGGAAEDVVAVQSGV